MAALSGSPYCSSQYEKKPDNNTSLLHLVKAVLNNLDSKCTPVRYNKD